MLSSRAVDRCHVGFEPAHPPQPITTRIPVSTQPHGAGSGRSRRRFGGRLEHGRAQSAHRDGDRDEHQAGPDQVREVIAGIERGGSRLAEGELCLGALGRQGREHREADRAAHLDAGVDEPRGQPRIACRGARHRERHQRGEAEPGAEADEDHRRQQVGRVVRVDRRAGQEKQSGDDDDHRWDERRLRAKPQVELCGEPERHRAHDRGHRQVGEADLEGVVAEDPLHVESAQEEHPEHPDDEQGLDQIRGADVRRAEQAQRHQGVRHPRLTGEERDEESDRNRRRGRASGSIPSPPRRPRGSCTRPA